MVQFLVLSCAVAALGPPGFVARDGAPDERQVTLAPGETTSAWSLRLRFDEVVTDSRCPTDVECVWAGSVEVAITVTAGAHRPPIASSSARSPDRSSTRASRSSSSASPRNG